MNLMDILLKKRQLTRYDVAKQSGISQQTLYSANKKAAESYSGKVLIALSQVMTESPGEVLDELIAIEKSREIYRAVNFQELKIAMESKTPRFIATGEVYQAILAISKTQLSETERLGFDLGSNGTGRIFESLLNKFWDFQDKSLTAETAKIKRQLIATYDFKRLSQNEIEVSLKSLTY